MQKNILIIASVLVLSIIVFFIFGNYKNTKTLLNPYADSEITAKIFKEGNGFGYDILIDDALYVHQPTIPAIGGNQTFKSSSDAQRAADLVISKIRQGILPPTVSIEELQTIGVIK